MRTSLLRSVSFLALASSSLAAHAGLFGSTVSLQRIAPNQGSVYHDAGAAVVGSGLEYAHVDSLGAPDTLDLTDTTFDLRQNFTAQFASLDFNGFELTVTSGAAITGATFVSGFAPRSISVTNGHLFVDYSGVSFDASQTSILSITTASAVPGPVAALPFALMALRRRKRA